MYEFDYLGNRTYFIDENNGMGLMLVNVSRKLADSVALALECAYAKGQSDKESELNAVLQEAGLDYPLGVRGVKDLVQQRDGQTARAEEAENELTDWRMGWIERDH